MERESSRAVTVQPGLAGALAAAASFRPHRHPRTSLALVLYVLGLSFMFLFQGRAPTPAERAAFKFKEAEVIAFEGLREAQAELIELEADVAAVKGWLPLVWRLDARRRERVARRMPAVRAARQRVADLQRQLDQKMREAKAALGLWSEVGVEESKALFWRSFASGKLFAQRQSFWDAVFTITLANFTTGMLIAVFAFLFQLPSLLASYGAPLWKALPFFAVASAGAISVAASYLGLLYGAGFGVAYGTVAVVAQRRQALLEGQAAERRRLAYEGHHHGD